jgi:acyl transferase domain-containing protein
LDYLRTAQAQVDLDSVAYTLQVGREAMEERLGFVVTSIDQLSERLGRYLDGATNVEGLVHGRVETSGDGIAAMGSDEDMRPTIERWLERRKLTKLLDLWVRGVILDWNKLYGDEKPRRVSLPAYPFARERCWIDGLQPERTRERDLAVDEALKSMEEIIDQISADLIEPELAVTALKMLV